MRKWLYLLTLFSLPFAGCSCGKSSAPTTTPRLSASAAPVQFSDVAQAAGIRFHHFNGASGKKYMPETMGSGGAFLDFDNDGWLDVLLLNGKSLEGRRQKAEGRKQSSSLISHPSSLILYHNNRNGTFSDVTKGSGFNLPLCAMGCCVGDYDNDGWPDVYITTALEPNRLFHNEGNGRFRDVTAQAGVGDPRWGTSCAWVDYDNDGWLDLFVGNYVKYRSLADDQWCSLRAGHKSYCTPEAYTGESCLLYRNNGNGTFSDVSQPSGVAAPEGMALGVALLDYDDDGWMDIAVANDERPNFLFHNVPNTNLPTHQLTRRFEEVGLKVGIALAEDGVPKAGMGIDASDCRNDGRLALLVSNFSNEGLSFFRQERTDLFIEASFRVGVGQPSFLLLGFGLFFGDYDNDGLQDAFVANGHVQDDINLLQSTITYAERNLLFRNLGDGNFREVGRQSGTPFTIERVSRGAAYGDYDNDGDLDILITNNNGPAELLRNEGGNKQNWLQVEVRGKKGKEGEGRGSNREAIGAKVIVKTGNVTQRQWVRSGSSYLSESMRRLHFGLGRAAQADLVEVRFPSGVVQRQQNVKANQRIVFEEP
jgi:hypothetical protein